MVKINIGSFQFISYFSSSFFQLHVQQAEDHGNPESIGNPVKPTVQNSLRDLRQNLKWGFNSRLFFFLVTDLLLTHYFSEEIVYSKFLLTCISRYTFIQSRKLLSMLHV